MNDNDSRRTFRADQSSLATAALVDEWLDALLDLIDLPDEALDGAEAHDLVALVGKLARLKAGVQAAAGAGPALERGRQRLRDEPEIVQRAARCVDLDGWGDRLHALDQSFARPLCPADRAEWAEDLIEELDDADLIAAALARIDADACAALRAALDTANDRLSVYESALMDALPYIKAVGSILDRESIAADGALARTVRKFDALGAAAARFDEAMGGGGRFAADPAILAWHPPALPAVVEPILFVARDRQAIAAADVEAAAPLRFEWNEPGAGARLVMLAPRVEPEGGRVRLKLEPDAARRRLAGRPLAVGGVRLTLDPQGRTWLAWEDLLAVQAQLDQVVVGQVRWRPAFELAQMVRLFGKPPAPVDRDQRS